jgi:hypothetical protein
MSLLNDASLVLIPSGYKEDKVYSIIPSDGSGDLDFVRGSDGTRINSLGQVERVCWNKLQYSEQINNTAAWQLLNGITISANSVASPTGTITADTLVDDGSGISIVRQFDYAVVGGQTYTFSVWLKKASGAPLTRIRIEEDAAPYNNTYLDVTPTDVWTRYSVTRTLGASITALNIGIFPDRNSGDSVYAWGAQLNVGSTAKPYFPTTDRLNVPRLTYENGCPSLLLEKQSTNKCLWSEQFDNAAWDPVNVTVTANNIISPDGTQNADKIEYTNNNNYFVAYSTNSQTTPYTISCYAKKGTTDLFSLREVYYSGSNAKFDLTNGSIVSDTTGNATIQSVGNGWYRCSITLAYTSSQTSLQWSFDNRLSTGNLYLWGAQIEASAYATSYIPTTSTSVTRLADSCSKTGISSLIGQTEGTIFYDGIRGEETEEMYLFLQKNGNTGINDSIYIIKDGVGIAVKVYVSGFSVNIVGGSYSVNQRIKIAFAYSSTSCALYINGVEIGVDSSATIPTCDNYQIGAFTNDANSVYKVSKPINQALLFKRRLTNTELAQLTTI